ncbi:DUF6233 domain-containing protein [Streptomyces sp. NBC_00118]|uniref:DUF6233 domain-containing protein n=1 Tax=Streptomyces sp. NBC_00118 TaxID=2975658 RepID=UPI003246C31B
MPPRRPPTPDWVVELSIGVGARPIEVHVGGCYAAGKRQRAITREQALAALADGIRACIHCRPDTELGCCEQLAHSGSPSASASAVELSLLHQGAAQARRAPQPPAAGCLCLRPGCPRPGGGAPSAAPAREKWPAQWWGNPAEAGPTEFEQPKEMPPAGALRLRDGWGATGDCWCIGASVGGSHPDHLRPRQSRAVAAQGVKVVRTVARSTLTP